MADAEIHLGRYNEAEKLLLSTFEARRHLLGEGHVNTLGSMHDLALLYLIQGQWGRAEHWLRRALQAPRPILGLEPLPPRVIMYFPESPPYHAKDQSIKGMPLLVQLLVPWVESTAIVSGAEDPDTLTITNVLAMLYHEQGRDDEAKPLLIQVLETRRRVFGVENPDTLSSLSDLASVYYGKQQYAEAEPLYTQSLAGRRRLLGTEPTDTLRCMANLADIYTKLGRYAEAAKLLAEMLTLNKTQLGLDHPDTLGCMYNAACAATLAGCGSGSSGPEPNDLERSRWREQARGWLSENLKYWTERSCSSRLENLREVAAVLEDWQHDPDLAGLRDAARIGQLPEQERSSCEQLWSQVNSLLALVQRAVSSQSSGTSIESIED